MNQHNLKFHWFVFFLFYMANVFIASAQSNPRRITRLSLCGAQLQPFQRGFVQYDPREKYYLCSWGMNVGDYVIVALTLTPSRDHAKRYGSDDNFSTRRAPLPRLKSGWGVNIGDTPQQVRAKLGAGPDKAHRDKKQNTLRYTYSVKTRLYEHSPALRKQYPMPKQWYRYQANYLFRNGNLWAISYWLFSDKPSPQ